MKFLAVFAAIFAVACANNTWTLQQLSAAISDPHTDAALKPYLENALNQMMDALWAGQPIEATTVTLTNESATSMTLNELSAALQNPNTDPALVPHLEAALNQIMDDLFAGVPVSTAIVGAPSMELHHYSLYELSAALQNPDTNPALVPYLEHALNEMMEAIFAGESMTVIVIAVPAGLQPVVPVVVAPPTEIPSVPAVPAVPAVPVVPETPASPTSPLVQIIVNVNQQQADAILPVGPVVAPAEAIAVDPVQVVDVAPVVIDPVQVVDVAPVVVDPVQVVDAAPGAGEPVLVAQPSFGRV